MGMGQSKDSARPSGGTEEGGAARLVVPGGRREDSGPDPELRGSPGGWRVLGREDRNPRGPSWLRLRPGLTGGRGVVRGSHGRRPSTGGAGVRMNWRGRGHPGCL